MPVFHGRFSTEPIAEYPLGPSTEEKFSLGAYELVVPVALTPLGFELEETPARPFPALIDTGFTGDFHISWKHFVEWGRFPQNPLELAEETKLIYPNGTWKEFRTYSGTLWFADTARRQFTSVDLPNGFSIYEDEVSEEGDPLPPLPVIGLRALRAARAQLSVDFGSSEFSLAIPS